ncbi:MAG: aminoacyl-tRNA hydrolase [Desulfomicrobium sp.]|jgi:PTH1 family peptidyl-tRNA hydrolase|nr:aminoacyl-tRNA hydrolase [Desulfomicrobium sp.]NLV96189.1 aminoacyl-tRNA hydrolase [Desulfovibrionales bacterium]
MGVGGLIVGLGNPGIRYARTRHNFGFLLVDLFIHYAQNQPDWSCSSRNFKGNAELWEVQDPCNKHSWLVTKPLTFMNLSGQVVGELCRKNALGPEQVIILHDELDLSLGTIRFKFSGGLAGHNGLKSVAAHLGTRDFVRLRLGIGRPVAGFDMSGYVLQSFHPEERDKVHLALAAALEALLDYCCLGLESAMAKAHTK